MVDAKREGCTFLRDGVTSQKSVSSVTLLAVFRKSDRFNVERCFPQLVQANVGAVSISTT